LPFTLSGDEGKGGATGVLEFVYIEKSSASMDFKLIIHEFKVCSLKNFPWEILFH